MVVPGLSSFYPSSPPCIFLLTGEGAHSTQTDIRALRLSSAWLVVDSAVKQQRLSSRGLEELLPSTLGSHVAPLSPVVTTVVNLLNTVRWRDAGFEPTMAIGHSIGEVAAVHVAGLLSVNDAIALAHGLGQVGASLQGGMLHTRVAHRELAYMQVSSSHDGADHARQWDDEPLCVAAINTSASNSISKEVTVTLCGPVARVAAWLESDPLGKMLPPLHPWHHPAYARLGSVHEMLQKLPHSDGTDSTVAFVSAARARIVQLLDATYWLTWLSTPGVHPPAALSRTVCFSPAGRRVPISCRRPSRSELRGRCGARRRAARLGARLAAPARVHGGDGAASHAHLSLD